MERRSCVESSLHAHPVDMLRAERFATPHTDILSQRVAVLGRTRTHTRRDTHGDLSIADHVAGERRCFGHSLQDAADGVEASGSRAGVGARPVAAPH